MSKGDKKKKIIAGIASSATLTGGATAGILYASDTEENEEEKRSKTSIGTINRPIEIKLVDETQDLATLLPESERNFGRIVMNQGDRFVVEQIKDLLDKKRYWYITSKNNESSTKYKR